MSATTDADRASANEADRMIREIADKIIGNRRLRLALYRQLGPGRLVPGRPDPGWRSDSDTDGVTWV
jgi:hypothetical protein